MSFAHCLQYFIILLIFITECLKLTAPYNGYVTQSGSAVGAVAHYSCKIGFRLIGSKSRSCTDTGNWTGTKPICKAISKSHGFFNHGTKKLTLSKNEVK